MYEANAEDEESADNCEKQTQMMTFVKMMKVYETNEHMTNNKEIMYIMRM